MTDPPSPERARRPDPPARARRRHLSGLPGERTLLAWDRTALALLANGALLILRDAGSTSSLRLVAAVLAGLLAAMCGVLARTRARAVADHQRHGFLHPPDRAALCLAAGVVAMGCLEVVAILVD
jgi:uncharacterized membrane protein YidH (DUF202 family)